MMKVCQEKVRRLLKVGERRSLTTAKGELQGGSDELAECWVRRKSEIWVRAIGVAGSRESGGGVNGWSRGGTRY